MTNENIKDDGGPAFPIPIASTNIDGGIYNTLEQSSGANGGMTLRDYFAGKAMGLEIARMGCHLAMEPKIHEAIAKAAYLVADAMLAERKK